MSSKHRGTVAVLIAAGCILQLAILVNVRVEAYDRWGEDFDQTGCNKNTPCHGDFRGTGGNGINEHNFHVAAATGNCDLCHWDPDGRNSPYTYKSTSLGDGTTEFQGCVGCHGTDYGDSRADQPNWMRSPGLRQKHEAENGAGTCITSGCHDTNEPATPNPENTSPPYYARADVNITDPCSSAAAADGGEDLGLGPAGGLDNDADGLRDEADPDCSTAETPGEADQLLANGYDPATGDISIAFTVGCGSTANALNYGPLAGVSTLDYTGQDCNAGNLGTYDQFNPDGGPGGSQSWFFLVVANDGSSFEGSYGLDGGSVERAPYASAPTCPFTQDLGLRCDP